MYINYTLIQKVHINTRITHFQPCLCSHKPDLTSFSLKNLEHCNYSYVIFILFYVQQDSVINDKRQHKSVYYKII